MKFCGTLSPNAGSGLGQSEGRKCKEGIGKN